jgi:hypothetical protein
LINYKTKKKNEKYFTSDDNCNGVATLVLKKPQKKVKATAAKMLQK